MTTALNTTLKRALIIDGRDYVVTLTDATLKLTLKGKRNGVELPWNQLVNGEAALAVALNASVGVFSSDVAAGNKAARAQQRPSAKSLHSAAAARRRR